MVLAVEFRSCMKVGVAALKFDGCAVLAGAALLLHLDAGNQLA